MATLGRRRRVGVEAPHTVTLSVRYPGRVTNPVLVRRCLHLTGRRLAETGKIRPPLPSRPQNHPRSPDVAAASRCLRRGTSSMKLKPELGSRSRTYATRFGSWQRARRRCDGRSTSSLHFALRALPHHHLTKSPYHHFARATGTTVEALLASTLRVVRAGTVPHDEATASSRSRGRAKPCSPPRDVSPRGSRRRLRTP